MKRFRLAVLALILCLVSVTALKAASGDLWALNVGGSDVIRVTSAGNLVPGTTNTIDIGSSSLKFKDLYVQGTITNSSFAPEAADFVPDTGDTYDLGQTGTRWENLWLHGDVTATGNATIGGTLGVTGASTLAAVSATTISASSTLGVTGASTLAAVSATSVTASGAVTLGDAQADTITINGTATLADSDGGNAASYNKLTARLNVKQTAGAGLDGPTLGYELLEDGETVTDWTATTNVTASADTSVYHNGSKSLKLAFTGSAVAGNGADTNSYSNQDWSGVENVGCWIYTDTALASGDMVLTITDGGAGATSVNIPAVATTGAWTFVTIDISGVADASKDDVDGLALDLSSQGATALGAFNVYFDSVFKWDNSGDLALSGNVLDGGTIGVMAIADANTEAHAMTMLVEGTDFWVKPGSSAQLIFITDQSANDVLATYCTQ